MSWLLCSVTERSTTLCILLFVLISFIPVFFTGSDRIPLTGVKSMRVSATDNYSCVHVYSCSNFRPFKIYFPAHIYYSGDAQCIETRPQYSTCSYSLVPRLQHRPKKSGEPGRQSHMTYVINFERGWMWTCLLYTSPSPRDATLSRMPSSA